MKLNRGYEHIKVTLLNFDGDNLAKRCYDFGRFAHDGLEPLAPEYDEDFEDVRIFVGNLIAGLTFPKYAFLANRIDFAVEGISRICLAQLTRDAAIFCSESHGLRPMSQELNMPLNMIDDPEIMGPFVEAQKLLEKAYVTACEKEIPYPESRYLMSHAQTISLTCSYTVADFARACFSRTNNSFCDELNYVYRKMFAAIRQGIALTVKDKHSITIWDWLINEEKCIDDSVYTRTNVFNGDFSLVDNGCSRLSQNDWRKSCWKTELERILWLEPHLLTKKEKETIRKWQELERSAIELPTTYDKSAARAACNAIKGMHYYEN